MKRILRVISRISREVPAFAARHKVWAGIVILLAFLAVVIYLPRVPGVGPRSGREAEGEFRGHLLQALGGLVLAVGAYFTGRTFALNREGQITERFTRAVEQLAADDEKLDIRLGGIYALERIARDSETHYQPVIEVLTAFLRGHARSDPKTAAPGKASGLTPNVEEPADEVPMLREDLQAAATVIGRRDLRHERPEHHTLFLRGVDLPQVSLLNGRLRAANLYRANLSHAILSGADLAMALLNDADLTDAYLDGANLAKAFLQRANLSRAYLIDANLSEADLTAADLTAADLGGANLAGANLLRANLSGTDLFRAGLSEANLYEARLSEANSSEADLSGADLSGAILSGADLSGAILSRANLSKADLSGAIGVNQEQLAEAITDEETKLPEYLDREPGG
jgi:uncharacterized protein YjbI with pentapeptide repeats